MTSYLNESLEAFLDRVAAKEPAPGGGAVAAVTVALAAGLVAMAARFSQAQLGDGAEVIATADVVRKSAASLAEADARAYGAVLAAYALPKERDPDGRRQQIRTALEHAAAVPLQIARLGVDAARQGARVAADGNPNLRGDAITAIHLAQGAVRSAAELAIINVELGNLDEHLRETAMQQIAAAEDAVLGAGGG